jgi:hypothetical protein
LREVWTAAPGETIRVHFGPAREFMLPLAAFRSLDPDPLLPLFGAMAELEPAKPASYKSSSRGSGSDGPRASCARS